VATVRTLSHACKHHGQPQIKQRDGAHHTWYHTRTHEARRPSTCCVLQHDTPPSNHSTDKFMPATDTAHHAATCRCTPAANASTKAMWDGLGRPPRNAARMPPRPVARPAHSGGIIMLPPLAAAPAASMAAALKAAWRRLLTCAAAAVDETNTFTL